MLSAFDGAEAYVAAALHAVEGDRVEYFIGTLLCRLDVVAQGGDAEHAAAGGDNFTTPFGRAGKEDMAVLGCNKGRLRKMVEKPYHDS